MDELEMARAFDLDLILGGPPFTVRVQRLGGDAYQVLHEAWELRRDELLADSRAGRRPWAWWRLERGEEQPPVAEEAVRLHELGELRPEEVEELLGEGDRLIAELGTTFNRKGIPPAITIANSIREVIGLPLLDFTTVG